MNKTDLEKEYEELKRKYNKLQSLMDVLLTVLKETQEIEINK